MFTYTAFEEFRILAHGSLDKVALVMRKRLKQNAAARVLLFSDSSGKQMDIDLSGSESEVIERLKIFTATEGEKGQSPGPGRPKLGVVSREISLLPRHWQWLSNQAGGSSAAIRRLVDEKMKLPLSEKEKVKQAQEGTYRFLSAIAGDLPHFEEAVRFLYRRDKKKFISLIADWPDDLVKHTLTLTENIFSDGSK